MSDFLPKRFVAEERRRVFVPDADFARRVLARIQPVARPATVVWEYVPGFARPVVAATALVLLVMSGLQMVSSDIPEQGIVDAYLAEDSTPSDTWLYQDAEVPEGDDLFLEITMAEELR